MVTYQDAIAFRPPEPAMKRSLRTAILAFAATVLVAISATAAALLPDEAGQVADMAAGLQLDGDFVLGSLEH
jgi:hypothetical protein